MVLRCTAKLLKVLGIRPSQLPELIPHIPWMEWYANLIWIERRKCLLITHAPTLFAVFVPDVLKSDLTPMSDFIARHVRLALLEEGLPPETFGVLDHLDLARTADRRILGCMNDQALHCEYVVFGHGGLDRCDPSDLNRSLRRSIHSLTGVKYPVELVEEHVRNEP